MAADIKAIITEDIYSIVNKGSKAKVPYLKKGQKVLIISKSLPAMIVEDSTGERWPVNETKLIIQK